MQNHCVLGSMKQMDLLRLMIKLDIVLFDYSQCDKVCDKIKYLISEKGDSTDSINNTFGTIRIDSYDSLPIENILTFHNVIILTCQLLIRMKITTSIIYFQKKICIKINPIHHIFK